MQWTRDRYPTRNHPDYRLYAAFCWVGRRVKGLYQLNLPEKQSLMYVDTNLFSEAGI
jgi:hypothetical protein